MKVPAAPSLDVGGHQPRQRPTLQPLHCHFEASPAAPASLGCSAASCTSFTTMGWLLVYCAVLLGSGAMLAANGTTMMRGPRGATTVIATTAPSDTAQPQLAPAVVVAFRPNPRRHEHSSAHSLPPPLLFGGSSCHAGRIGALTQPVEGSGAGVELVTGCPDCTFVGRLTNPRTGYVIWLRAARSDGRGIVRFRVEHEPDEVPVALSLSVGLQSLGPTQDCRPRAEAPTTCGCARTRTAASSRYLTHAAAKGAVKLDTAMDYIQYSGGGGAQVHMSVPSTQLHFGTNEA
jgi:hypothetical protein